MYLTSVTNEITSNKSKKNKVYRKLNKDKVEKIEIMEHLYV